MWNIGNVKIKNRVVLAPMAGISNTSYRKIIKDMGCGLIFAEMVSDRAIMYGNDKTIDLLKMSDYERPIVQQIFGNSVETFVIAAKKVMELMHPDIIDINMGCPVPKIALRSQAGSALLKNPLKIGEIVNAVSHAVDVPVTVKIRLGWDEDNINCVDVAKIIEQNGGSAITIHARTRSQGYSGSARWEYIKMVKDSVSIPVIGNGDVRSPMDAKRMLDETGCDAVMIGRAVLGNPWLIKQTVDYLNTGYFNRDISLDERMDMIKKHFNYLIKDKNEKSAMLEIRSHAIWYLKGISGSKKINNLICQSKNIDEIFDILDKFKNGYI